MSGIPSVGGVGVPTEVQNGSKPEDAELAQADSAGSALNLPQEPAAPNGATVVSTQNVLTQQTKRAPAAGIKSNFRLLVEAGRANVKGWKWNTGKMNYWRKCVTDIPKGFIQGVVSGLSAGCFNLPQCGRGGNTSLLSWFFKDQKDELLYFGLSALATNTISARAYNAAAPGTEEQFTERYLAEFAQRVKDAKYVTYTPAKIGSFGVGAAIGSAVPTVLAVILYGPGALYMAAKERITGGETPLPASDLSATADADQAARVDAGAGTTASKPSAE